MVDWTYDNVLGSFTALTTGVYIVDYTVIGADSGSRIMSVRGAINNSEIIGSAVTLQLQSASSGETFDNSFIMNITSGNLFSCKNFSSYV